MTEAIETMLPGDPLDDDPAKPSPAEHDLMDDWDPIADEHAKAYGVIASVVNDGQWHKWFEIWDHVAAANPGLTEATAKTFFRKVVRQGWLTRGNQAGPEQYRVTRTGLIERPELRGREGQLTTPTAWREQLRSQVDWLADPRLPRPDPVPEQPRPEEKSARKAADTAPAAGRPAPANIPAVATIIAIEGQLHPTENCQCGQRLVFRNGKNPPKGDRWQCPLYRGNPGWEDPNHVRKWANP